MTKITKSVSYAINWLVTQGKKAEEIATELKLTEEQVTAYLKKNTKALPIKSSPVNSKSRDLMIRHTRDKKNNSVAIMTKEASEVNDELKRKLITEGSKRNQDCIFKPNNS
jgi:predicted transcriptional regulator